MQIANMRGTDRRFFALFVHPGARSSLCEDADQ
jgi:hypothetical protein